MNDFIFTQCPNCQTKYQVSLNVVSAGKSKAKCGHCKTSFIIKDNMVNHSFLEESNLVSTKSVVDTSQSDNDINQATSKPSTEQYYENTDPLLPDDSDNLSLEDDSFIPEDFGKEWYVPVEELQSEDKLFDFNNFDSILSKEAEGSDDDSWTILTPPVDLNGAPPYYVSTNSNLNIPFEHRTFVPAINVLSFEAPTKRKQMASYITPYIWLIGCLFLSFLLLAQYTFFHLDNLVKNPFNRHRLQDFCDIITCTIPNADINQISIIDQAYTSSIFKEHYTDISASIINNSHEDQVFPNIEVKIYGSDGIIADFVAMPADYLVTPQRILGQSQLTAFKLTVPVENNDINQIEIKPFY